MRGQGVLSGIAPPSPSPFPSGKGGASALVAGDGDFLGDDRQNAVQILGHLVVPEADHAVAVGFADAGAVRVCGAGVSGKLRGLSLLLTLPLAITACGPVSHSVTVDLPSTIDFSDGFQQSDADAILRKCNAKDIKLIVKPNGEIIFEPSPNADYEASVCVLEYIKQSGTTKFGFVGNEKYRAEDE